MQVKRVESPQGSGQSYLPTGNSTSRKAKGAAGARNVATRLEVPDACRVGVLIDDLEGGNDAYAGRHRSSGEYAGGQDGAQGETRTRTSLRTLAPEASASTNSATWAAKNRVQLRLSRGSALYESLNPLSIRHHQGSHTFGPQAIRKIEASASENL